MPPVTVRVCVSCRARSRDPRRHGPTLLDESRRALRLASALAVAVESTGCNDLCDDACSAVVLSGDRPIAAFGRLETSRATAEALVAFAARSAHRLAAGDPPGDPPASLADHALPVPVPG